MTDQNAPVGLLHHVELWVPDLESSRVRWEWLLTALGYERFQSWPHGVSYRLGHTYLVLEQSPALCDGGYERRRPGLNHLAFHAGARSTLDRLVDEAERHGWNRDEWRDDRDVREILTAEQAEVLARVDALSRSREDIIGASQSANADDEHDPEGSTIAFERAQVAALLAQARAHLTEVTGALQRLDAGGYGRCERCGSAITPERLRARPTARTCIHCAVARHGSRR